MGERGSQAGARNRDKIIALLGKHDRLTGRKLAEMLDTDVRTVRANCEAMGSKVGLDGDGGYYLLPEYVKEEERKTSLTVANALADDLALSRALDHAKTILPALYHISMIDARGELVVSTRGDAMKLGVLRRDSEGKIHTNVLWPQYKDVMLAHIETGYPTINELLIEIMALPEDQRKPRTKELDKLLTEIITSVMNEHPLKGRCKLCP